MNQMPEVLKCDLLAGPNCYVLIVKVASMGEYNTYLREALVNLPGVYAIESRIVIGPVKDTSHLPLG